MGQDRPLGSSGGSLSRVVSGMQPDPGAAGWQEASPRRVTKGCRACLGNDLSHVLGNDRAEVQMPCPICPAFCAASDVHPLVKGGDQGAAPVRPGDPHSPWLLTWSHGRGARETPYLNSSCACCISYLEFSEKLSSYSVRVKPVKSCEFCCQLELGAASVLVQR